MHIRKTVLFLLLVLTSALSAAEYNVVTYGATGNGVTNDAAAFSSAIAAADTAGGGIVVVPCPATAYLISSQVSVTNVDNVTIRGEGYCSKIQLNVTDIGFAVSGGSRVGFEELRFTGTSARPIAYRSHTFPLVRSCTISGATNATSTLYGTSDVAAGIYCSNCDDGLIAENTLSGNGYGASNSVFSADILFTGGGSRNRITGNAVSSTAVTGHIGIQTDNSNQTCRDNQVTENRISGAVSKIDNSAWGYGIWLYQYLSDVLYTTVAGNQIRDTGGPGIFNQGSKYTVIDGNVLEDTVQTMSGAHLAGAIAVSSIASDLVISDNQIRTSGKAGIRFDAVRSSITGNGIEGTAGPGIYFGVGVDQVEVIGNTIKSALGGGIIGNTNVTSSHVVISGNTLQTIGYNGTSWSNGAYGISIPGVTRLTIANNTIHETGAYGILLYDCERFSVDGNVVSDASKYSSNVYDTIHVNTAEHGVVSDNTAWGSGRYGIAAAGASTVEIVDNNVVGNQTGGVTTAGSTNVSRDGNRLSTGPVSGQVTLSAGTATVSTAEVQTGDIVQLTILPGGGTPGVVRVSAIAGGTSFTITSTSPTDTSVVGWRIVH